MRVLDLDSEMGTGFVRTFGPSLDFTVGESRDQLTFTHLLQVSGDIPPFSNCFFIALRSNSNLGSIFVALKNP